MMDCIQPSTFAYYIYLNHSPIATTLHYITTSSVGHSTTQPIAHRITSLHYHIPTTPSITVRAPIMLLAVSATAVVGLCGSKQVEQQKTTEYLSIGHHVASIYGRLPRLKIEQSQLDASIDVCHVWLARKAEEVIVANHKLERSLESDMSHLSIWFRQSETNRANVWYKVAQCICDAMVKVREAQQNEEAELHQELEKLKGTREGRLTAKLAEAFSCLAKE